METAESVRSAQRVAVILAVGILALIAVGAFVLAYKGQTDYMVTVAQYPRGTAWVGPAVVEGTLAMTLLAGLAVPLSGWTRFWVWLSMGLASVGSVFGNVAVAEARHLSAAGVVTHGSWSLWVILAEVTAVIIVRKVWPWTQPGQARPPVAVTMVDTAGPRPPLPPLPVREPGASARFMDDSATVTEAPVTVDPPVTTRGGLSLVARPEWRTGGDRDPVLQAAHVWLTRNGAAAPLPHGDRARLADQFGVSEKTVARRFALARKQLVSKVAP